MGATDAMLGDVSVDMADEWYEVGGGTSLETEKRNKTLIRVSGIHSRVNSGQCLASNRNRSNTERERLAVVC